MKKPKIFLYGNCQSPALKLALSNSQKLQEIYDIYTFKPVHLINLDELENIKNALKNCDVFIHQPVSNYKGAEAYNTEVLKTYLKSDALSISFPSIYFNGYHPQMNYFYLNDKDLANNQRTFLDSNIFYFYLLNFSPEKVMDIIEDENFYSNSDINNILNTTIKNLKTREELNNVTIKVSNFIVKNFKSKKIFFTLNHPSVELIAYVANKILKILNIDDFIQHTSLQETLDFIQLPIYPSTAKLLELTFQFNQYYYRKAIATNKCIVKETTLETINKLYYIWNTEPQATHKNKELLLNKYKNLLFLPAQFRYDQSKALAI